MKKLTLLLGLLLPLPLLAADLIPVEDFVRHPTYSEVRISPTGKYLAMTVDRGDQDVLVVLKTADLSLVKVNQLPENKSVGQFRWVGPERLMFNAIRKVGSFAQPFGTGEWFGVNADGSQPRPLIFYGSRGVTQRGKTVGNEFYNLLDPLRDDDRNVLMTATYPRSMDGSGTELVLMDSVSGTRRVLAKAPRENCSLSLDEKKQARFAVCFDDENEKGEYDIVTELYRYGEDGKWQKVGSSSGGKQVRVFGAAGDGRIYAIEDDGKAPAAFGTLDQQTGAFKKLFQDPVSEVAEYILASDGETVIAVVTMAGAPRVHVVEPDHPDTTLYANLARAFPGQFVDFSSATTDGKQIVVSVRSDANPGELYLYDRDSGKARFLMASRKWIDPERMATVMPFELTSRDGLKLHGYLTLPRGVPHKNLPMVVNPHGGPMGPRDDWEFNGETQLLASRGYAVLQVNFRGSGGYGKAFQDMAYGQWAEGIQNDIIDATRWAIAQGYADGERVCIYGGSFGGYSALMAPVRDPDLFACAFGYVGVYDAEIQMKLSDTSKSESGLRYLRRALGNTEAERAAVMPITYASKIDLPVYLAAGARDPRCPPENTEAMRDALVAAGNPPEGVIIQSGEMHGFYGEEARKNLYTEMLAFFGRHIGGKVTVGEAQRDEVAGQP